MQQTDYANSKVNLGQKIQLYSLYKPCFANAKYIAIEAYCRHVGVREVCRCTACRVTNFISIDNL